MSLALRLLGLLCLVMAIGCLAPVDQKDISLTSTGCEAPTDELATPGARMLPGSLCQGCHGPGGIASNLTWTLSGTVLNSVDAPCNTGGVEDATVDIIDANDNVLITLNTNRSGNFFTSEDFNFKLVRARISKNGKVMEMQGLVGVTACASCHHPAGPAPGRIYLD